MSGSFIERLLTFEISLGKGAFGESGSTTVNLSGYRAVVSIVKHGSGGFGQAEIRIFGLDLNIMNQVSTLGSSYLVGNQRRNQVIVSAGDAVNGMAQVFSGTIVMTRSEFAGSPDVSFVILAQTAFYFAMKPVTPLSFSGSVNVSTIMSNIAAQIGIPFENNGVSVILNNPYLPGTAHQQAAAAARAAHINWTIDSETGPLAIWNKGQSRGGQIPLYSPQTGMIGYPSYTQFGITVRAIYTPGNDPFMGGQVQVQSSLQPATGKWIVYAATYELSSQMPGGDWSMTLSCQGLVQNATYGAPIA
jgi:hypothetical protein